MSAANNRAAEKIVAKPKVIAIVGPTASGKTALGITLAKALRGEVISADSRQVYRGLDIGTGKVTKTEMAGVPHHLLDIASPKTQISASQFEKKAGSAIAKITMKHRVPIVVGGTGFYIDTLLGRMVIPEVPPNEKLRATLENKSTQVLFSMLQNKDPRRAATIEPDHKRRLIRALEIAAALGKNPEPKTADTYEVLWLGLNPGEEVLQKKIRVRLVARIKRGMIAEAKRLHAAGLSYARMEQLGLEYRSLARLLRGDITKDEFVEELDRAIVQYAKRQMRWFKRNDKIHWVKNSREALRLSKTFLGA